MLNTPDTKVLEALANLEHNGNWTVVRAWLSASKDKISDALDVAEQPQQVHRMQGGKIVLRELLKHSTEARSILNSKQT